MKPNIFNLIVIMYYLMPIVISVALVWKKNKRILLFCELFSVFFIIENIFLFITESIISIFVSGYLGISSALWSTTGFIGFLPVLVFAFIYFLRKGAV